MTYKLVSLISELMHNSLGVDRKESHSPLKIISFISISPTGIQW